MSNLPDLAGTGPTVRLQTRWPWGVLLVLFAALLVPAYAQGQVFTLDAGADGAVHRPEPVRALP